MNEVNKIYYGDNLDIMKGLGSEIADLIYLDPPYFTQTTHTTGVGSFEDRFENLGEYLDIMSVRLVEMKRILKRTGTIFFQCDHRVSHYIKVELDKIFRRSNFKNEIIWQDSNRPDGSTTKILTKSYESIFWYSKTGKHNVYLSSISKHRDTDEVEKKYNRIDESGRRYTTRSLLRKKTRTQSNSESQMFEFKGYDPKITGLPWLWRIEKLIAADEKGDIIFSSTGKPEAKCYPEDDKGTPPLDIWDDIKPVYGKDGTYPTQKPEKLLERIILLGTKENDVVMDPFMGGGTTCKVAQDLGRKYIGIDKNPQAYGATLKRLGLI